MPASDAMSAPKILFVDRDGTLIVEPADEQIDADEKFRLVPGAIGALRRLVDAGYELVMVSNQDGLGTASFPEDTFIGPQRLLLDILAGEGIGFREILIDRSFAHEHLPTRKPGVGLVRHWLADGALDRARSAVIGDRDTDLDLAANMGLRGFRLGADLAWRDIAAALLDAPRRAHVERSTRETRIVVDVDLDAPHLLAAQRGDLLDGDQVAVPDDADPVGDPLDLWGRDKSTALPVTMRER